MPPVLSVPCQTCCHFASAATTSGISVILTSRGSFSPSCGSGPCCPRTRPAANVQSDNVRTKGVFLFISSISPLLPTDRLAFDLLIQPGVQWFEVVQNCRCIHLFRAGYRF